MNHYHNIHNAQLYAWVVSTLAKALFGGKDDLVRQRRNFSRFLDLAWNGARASATDENETLVDFNPTARTITFKCLNVEIAKEIGKSIGRTRRAKKVAIRAPGRLPALVRKPPTKERRVFFRQVAV